MSFVVGHKMRRAVLKRMSDGAVVPGFETFSVFRRAPRHDILDSSARNTVVLPQRHDLGNLAVDGSRWNIPRSTIVEQALQIASQRCWKPTLAAIENREHGETA